VVEETYVVSTIKFKHRIVLSEFDPKHVDTCLYSSDIDRGTISALLLFGL